MMTITAEPALRDALKQVRGLAEVRDPQGALLGYALAPMSREHLQLYLKALAEYDPVEMQRRKRDEAGKGKPLQEALAALEASERSSCATP